MAVTVEMYNSQDQEGFINLHREIFNSNMNQSLFNWKYIEQPFSTSPNIAVAKENKNLVGAVGTMYVPLKIDNKPIKASHPMDIMIEEEYRSHRLFRDLIEKLREGYNDVAVEYGTGVKETRKAWERFGKWKYNSVDIKGRIQEPERLIGISEGYISSFLEQLIGVSYRSALTIRDKLHRLDQYSGSIKKGGFVESKFNISDGPSYPVSIRRNSAFWNWRIDDPRINNVYTYYIKNEKNIANMLLIDTEDYGHKIALQNYSTKNNGFSALLAIYNRIFNEFTHTTFTIKNNNIDELSERIGLTHFDHINNITKSKLMNKVVRNADSARGLDELDKKPVGHLWFPEVSDKKFKSSKWEFGYFITD